MDRVGEVKKAKGPYSHTEGQKGARESLQYNHFVAEIEYIFAPAYLHLISRTLAVYKV